MNYRTFTSRCAFSLLAFSLLMPLPSAFAGEKQDAAWSKSSAEKKQQYEARKTELARRRGNLVNERAKLAARVAEIDRQLTRLGEDSSSGRGNRAKNRMVGQMLVNEQLDVELKVIVEDQAIYDLDSKRLSLDRKIYELEKNKFESEHGKPGPLVTTSIERFEDAEKPETASKGKSSVSRQRDLLRSLEPLVIRYWGNKRLALTDQVLKTRENRLQLWQDEIKAHKEFLDTKKEDAESGKKRASLRQKLLKDYFRLRKARQRLNSELIMAENEAWQASERMKYELGSIYRRLAYLNRLSGSKKVKAAALTSSKFDLSPKEPLKVGQHGTGIVFDDFFNWGSRVKAVEDGSSAQKKGLRSGDEVVIVDGSPVLGSERSFRSLLRGPEDKEIQLTVNRDGLLYKLPLKLNYRPEEKTHPQIVKALKQAKDSGDDKALVEALLEEIDYTIKYSRSHEVADHTVEELLELLKESKDGEKLPAALRLKAYAHCSAHYLKRMSEEISRNRKTSSRSKNGESGDSATFLNQADECAQKALDLATVSDKGDLSMSVELLELANQYRRQYDFRHIGTEDTLRKLCDKAVAATLKRAEQSPYDSATILAEFSEIYELTLKDSEKASEVLVSSLETYLKVIPEEAQEVTTTRLALSRNYSRLKKFSEAIKVLEERLATIERVQSYSRKSREYSMYDYVTSLKELGKLYPRTGQYKEALASASKILEVYNSLDAVEDQVFNEALFLTGKSSLKTGKVKQSVTYLTDALSGLEKREKTSCLLDLAAAYQKLKKPNEVRLIAVILKDDLNQQLAVATNYETAREIGDLSVRSARLLESIDASDESLSFLDLALRAYGNSIALKMGPELESDQGKKELKALAQHFVDQVKKLEPVLESAGRTERLESLKKYSAEINSKLSSSEELSAEWLVRVPKEL